MRRKTREILVGKVKIGNNNPISIQSMTNTLTKDAQKTIKQIHKLEEAGGPAAVAGHEVPLVALLAGIHEAVAAILGQALGGAPVALVEVAVVAPLAALVIHHEVPAEPGALLTNPEAWVTEPQKPGLAGA